MGRWYTVAVVAALASCAGDKDDTTIEPLDDGDADTDADADSDTDTDSDADTDPTTPELCGLVAIPADAVDVALTDDLAAAVAAAAPGATLALADGIYAVTGPLRLTQPITLVSRSQSPDAVTIDGGRVGGDLIEVTGSDVVLAHLTLANSVDHLVHVAPASGDLTGVKVHDVHLVDAGHAGVRIEGAGPYADDGEVSCSTIELTDAGRSYAGSQCAVGGIEAEGARGWTVRDNHLVGFFCPFGQSGAGIRFWRGSRDTVITRNQLNDVSIGIVAGETQDQIGRTYPDAPCGPAIVQSIGATVTNNIVAAYRDDLVDSDRGIVVGIRAESSCDLLMVHNSVFAVAEPSSSSIEHRFAATTGSVGNNLMSHVIRRLDDSAADDVQNLENVTFDTWFFPAQGDFHTAPAATWAIDQGSTEFLDRVPDDVDAEPRSDGLPDVGADER
ncbi:MAG: hypothetical protein ABMB14_35595 [Myxococcota bacterium]